jgi:hypothetical protein
MKASPYLATSIATLIFTLGGSRAVALPTGEAVARGKADFNPKTEVGAKKRRHSRPIGT